MTFFFSFTLAAVPSRQVVANKAAWLSLGVTGICTPQACNQAVTFRVNGMQIMRHGGVGDS